MLDRVMAKPAAPKTLAIHFTPRSGSSRLTEILRQTNCLGRANELFNPNFLPNIAAKFQAPDLATYIALARRRLRHGDVFSFEITAFQLDSIFGSPSEYNDFFKDALTIWLIREDIVLQAVSLTKMVTLKMAHSTQPDFDPDVRMTYDAAALKRWLLHIRRAEQLSEAYFETFGIAPLRLSYEQTVKVTPFALANMIARYCGTTLDIAPEFDLNHRKIGNDESQQFAERFRSDEAAFVAEICNERAPMLARIQTL